MKTVKRIGNFYWQCNSLKKLFREKLIREQRNTTALVIKNLHNLHKNPLTTPNMLLKTFKLESRLQRCASTTQFSIYATLALIPLF